MKAPAQDRPDCIPAFAPRRLLSLLKQRRVSSAEPVLETQAIALLADISHFTTVAERLQARYGVEGADRLSELLNICFDLMIDRVESTGGDVASIQGDSLLAVWYLPDDADDDVREHALRRASVCATSMHVAIVGDRVLAQEGLGLHIGLAVGTLLACATRSAGGRQQTICAGAVVVDACIAMNQAAAGSTAASASYWNARRSPPPGRLLGERCVALGPEHATSMAPAAIGRELEDASLLAAFVPQALDGAVQAAHIALLTQSRLITAMFCRIRGIDGRAVQGFETLRGGIDAIQLALRRHCGSLDKINVDEAGVFLVVLFGLPDAAGLGNARGAVESALAIEAHVATIGHAIAIGIATGRSNCSVIGNAARAHYTVHGAVPNLAARFMEVAGCGVVCDGETVRVAEGFFEFEQQRPAPLKGLQADSTLYRLRGRRTVPEPPPRFAGRLNALRDIARALAAVCEHAGQRVLLISGEQGCGKSALAVEVLVRARELGFHALEVRGDHTLSNAPLAAWSACTGDPGTDPLGLARTFAAMSLLILLEDGQWLDEASWGFARALAREHGRCVVLALSRSRGVLATRWSPAEDTDESIVLGPLAPDEAARVVHACTGVATVSAAALDWLRTQSRGNPAMLVALARALRASGSLAPVRSGILENASDGFDRIALPAEVQGDLTWLIDELPIAAQWLFKVASLSTSALSLDELALASPWSSPEATLADALARLLDAGHLLADGGGEPVRYRVAWPLLGRAAASLLSRRQRQTIHERLAGLHDEGARTQAHAAVQAARHWAGAGLPGRAFACLDLASSEAMAASRFAEAAVQLESMRELLDAGLAIDASTRARVLVWLGQCHVSSGRLSDGEACARLALPLLGKPMPVSSAGWCRLFAGQLLAWILSVRARSPSAQATAAMSAAAVDVFAAATYFSASALPLVTSSLWSVNLARRQGRLHTAARAAAVVGYFFGLCRLHRAARSMFQAAQVACESAQDQAGRHSVLGGRAMYELGFARWAATHEHIGQAIELCRRVGDPNDIRMALTIAGLADHYAGDFARSHATFEQVYDSSAAEGNRQHMAWGAYAKAQNLIPMGRCREAAFLLQEAGDLLAGVDDKHSALICSSLMALAHLHCADYVRARETSLLAAAQAAQTLPNNFGSFAGYYSLATTLIALWGRALCFSPSDAPGLQRETQVAMERFARYAMLFPVARPRLTLLRGWVDWRLGRRLRAHRAWHRSLAQSIRLQMPYERALAHWSLQHSTRAEPEREHHGRQAAQLLARCTAIPLLVEVGQPALNPV